MQIGREVLHVFEREYRVYSDQARSSEIIRIVGIAFVVVGTILFVGHLLTHHPNVEPRFLTAIADRNTEVVRDIVTALLAHSQNLRVEAKQLITVIFVVASIGITMFYLAGDLSYDERASKSKLVESSGNFQSNHDKALKALSDALDKAFKELAFTEDASVKANLLRSIGANDEAIAKLAGVNTSLQQLHISLNRNILISSALSRSGILLIMGYLIRILLSAYKYDTKLATLLATRAYALALTPAVALPAFGELVKLLEPGPLDFEPFVTPPGNAGSPANFPASQLLPPGSAATAPRSNIIQ